MGTLVAFLGCHYTVEFLCVGRSSKVAVWGGVETTGLAETCRVQSWGVDTANSNPAMVPQRTRHHRHVSPLTPKHKSNKSLKARRYQDGEETLEVSLGPSLLTRFSLLNVMSDLGHQVEADRLAEHVGPTPLY